jgi:hypothetical protein
MKGTAMSLVAAAGLLGAAGAHAQEREHGRFTSYASYSFSVPVGDTRQFLSSPSWMGVSWEGQWLLRSMTSAGVAIGINDFYDRSNRTTDFDGGSATGEQVRDLLVATLMGTGRWFPGGSAGRGFYLAIGAGGILAQQSYQLGVMPQLVRTAFHAVVAPEAGMTVGLFEGIDGVVNLRYTLPNAAGSYLGGSSRSFQFVTLSLGIAEH